MTRNPHVLPLSLTLLIFAALIGAALFLSTRSAYAEIEGPCSATIAGADVASLDSGSRSDDITVSKDDAVVVGAASAVGFESHKVQLEFAGRRWTVSDEEDDGSPAWTGTVNVDDYATYGVGLYKVIGVSTLSDGTTCEGAATVDVGGNPLTTVAGAGAVAATAVGLVGAVGSGVMASRGNPGPLSEFGPLGEMTADAWREDQARQTREAEGGTETARETLERFTWNPFIDWMACLCLAAVALIMTPLLAMTGGGGAPGGGKGPSGPITSPAAAARLPRAP